MSRETSAKRLFACIGEIADLFLAEAEEADIVSARKARNKRVVRYSALGAAAAAASVGVGFVAAYLLRRPGRSTGVTVSILQETA